MKIKVKNLLISFGIALVMCALCILPNMFVKSNEVATRTIDVSEIGTLSYEDKVEHLKQQFSNIEVSADTVFNYFSCDINFDSMQLLSTEYENCMVSSHIETSINNVNESLQIEITTIADDEIIYNLNSKYQAKYIEEQDKYLLVDEDGNEIDILQELESDNIDECFVWLLAPLVVKVVQVIVVAVAVTATVYVATHAEQIAESIATLTAGVKDGATSFWDNLRIKLGTITATKLDKPFVITSENVGTLQKTAEQRQDCYLLCEAISSTAEITTLYKFTNLANASLWIKKGGSVWSPNSSTAQACIKNAGYIPGALNKQTNQYQPYLSEYHTNGLIRLMHYHPLNKSNQRVLQTAHSLYGIHIIL